MTQIPERHISLIKKDQELQRLFQEAARRRKKLIQEKNDDNHRVISDNLVATDNNDNKIGTCLHTSGTHLHPSFHPKDTHQPPSHHRLLETNLDYQDTSTHNHTTTNGQYYHSPPYFTKSSNHNPHFSHYSTSSEETDVCNYCQFIPTNIWPKNHTTSSSQCSKSNGKSSSLVESSSSENDTHSDRNVDDNTKSVRYIDGNVHCHDSYTAFYPSRSPLIDHKYQGSPVVSIDNKLRAEEADYFISRLKSSFGQPPKPLTCVTTSETRLSHPVLVDIVECHNGASPPMLAQSPTNIPATTIIRRTRKKLLEEQMRMRFSVGDYSTRALIEWENNLRCVTIEPFSLSGDLPNAVDNEPLMTRRHSSNSDDVFGPVVTSSSAVNVRQLTDSLKEPQVRFSLQKDSHNNNENNKSTRTLDRPRVTKKGTVFRRSMNDLAAAFKAATASEKVPSFRRVVFHRAHLLGHGMFKKRDSTSNDLLYSIPPFARKHMPTDLYGSSKIIVSPHTHLLGSTPNLIAELDPTFHARCPLESPDSHNSWLPHHKRNRSYRLSFIENADTVTTKKLTDATSPSDDSNLRFVQPRRRRPRSRISSRNSAILEPVHGRSRSTNRFSCAQQ